MRLLFLSIFSVYENVTRRRKEIELLFNFGIFVSPRLGVFALHFRTTRSIDFQREKSPNRLKRNRKSTLNQKKVYCLFHAKNGS